MRDIGRGARSRIALRDWAEDLGWGFNANHLAADIYHPLHGTDGREMDSNDSVIRVLFARDGAVRSAHLVVGDDRQPIKGGVQGIVKLMIFKSHYASDTGCPAPSRCEHTTYVDGESCECCGKEITEEDHP